MTFERFKNIVEYNLKHQSDLEEKTREFRERLGIAQERNLPNLSLFARPILNQEKYLVLEIPFHDEEIGAVSYKRGSRGYVFLNSSLPRMNVNFALAHELYHVFYQKKPYGRKMEVYMSEQYQEYEEEHAANLFAGMLMMPATVFRYMMIRFSLEQKEEDTILTSVVKLMCYFEVPYMAVLIRLYELRILTDGETLEHLLSIEKLEIQEEFARLWLNEEILKANYKNDYMKFKKLVTDVGINNVNKGLMKEEMVAKILAHLDAMYEKIRG